MPKSWLNIIISALLFCIVPWQTLIAADIVILGLFKNKVVLNANGQRYVLKIGEKTPDGIELISADSKGATIKINGKSQYFVLGTQIKASYTQAEHTEVRISRDDHGMYRISGKINGNSVNYLVDTGATMVAINSNTARSIGIDYKKDENGIIVNTASGNAMAHKVVLDTVSVGTITLRNVHAVVVEGNAPQDVLLGMSFLKRLEMKDSNSLMVLRQKY